MRELDPHSGFEPDCPEVGDIVKVYSSATNGYYYMLGRVEAYDEGLDQYTVWCYNRGGEPIKTTASANRVESVLKMPHRKIEDLKVLYLVP